MKKKLLSLLLILALLLAGCALPADTAAPVSGEGLTVSFIDVGQADCALLECGGEFMLIDGGNRDDGQLVVSYLEQQGVETLSAVVCTHAHEDHVGGLPSVLAVYPTQAVYAPTRTYASKVFDDFVYYTDQQGLEITIPAPGDTWTLGQASVTVLGPVKSYAETNDTSIVLRVSYGETDFLFTGDMETTAENDMLDYWGGRISWQADVLKVGDHGSNTSTGLLTELRKSRALDVSKMAYRDDNRVIGIEVLGIELVLVRNNLRTALITIFLLHLKQLVLHNLLAKLWVAEYLLEVCYLSFEFFILCVQLVHTQARELRESHIDDCLRLQLVYVKPLLQVCLSLAWRLACADDMYNLVDIVASNDETFQNVCALLCLLQVVLCTPYGNVMPVVNEVFYTLYKGQQFWTSFYQCNAID